MIEKIGALICILFLTRIAFSIVIRIWNMPLGGLLIGGAISCFIGYIIQVNFYWHDKNIRHFFSRVIFCFLSLVYILYKVYL